MINYFKQLNKSKGYTLLFSVLVSSLVLAIGISILNVSKKEFLIATATRDSSSALYAADAGIECALYSDSGTDSNGNVRDTFNTENDNRGNFGCFMPTSDTITRVIDTASSFSPPPGVFTFAIKSGVAGNSCANVWVTKEWACVGGTGGSCTGGSYKLRTTYEARGYNTGWDVPDESNSNVGTCSVPSAKRVERGLKYVTF